MFCPLGLNQSKEVINYLIQEKHFCLLYAGLYPDRRYKQTAIKIEPITISYFKSNKSAYPQWLELESAPKKLLRQLDETSTLPIRRADHLTSPS